MKIWLKACIVEPNLSGTIVFSSGSNVTGSLHTRQIPSGSVYPHSGSLDYWTIAPFGDPLGSAEKRGWILSGTL